MSEFALVAVVLKPSFENTVELVLQLVKIKLDVSGIDVFFHRFDLCDDGQNCLAHFVDVAAEDPENDVDLLADDLASCVTNLLLCERNEDPHFLCQVEYFLVDELVNVLHNITARIVEACDVSVE